MSAPAVLNGCRSELRARRPDARRPGWVVAGETAASAEQDALVGDEHRQVLAALRRPPGRQREVLTLRYFLDLRCARRLPAAHAARWIGSTSATTNGVDHEPTHRDGQSGI